MPRGVQQEQGAAVATPPASERGNADTKVSGGNGGGNALLDLSGKDFGLKLRGMVLTKGEVRSGISKKNNSPYAIQTSKVLAGSQTYNWTQVRSQVAELPPLPPVGTVVTIEVESANKKNPESDLEIQGEVVV